MDYKNKKKLSSEDKEKIQARYTKKLEEYKSKTLEELQEIYKVGKISSTDRHAIVVATNYLLREKAVEIAKEKEVINGEGTE